MFILKVPKAQPRPLLEQTLSVGRALLAALTRLSFPSARGHAGAAPGCGASARSVPTALSEGLEPSCKHLFISKGRKIPRTHAYTRGSMCNGRGAPQILPNASGRAGVPLSDERCWV